MDTDNKSFENIWSSSSKNCNINNFILKIRTTRPLWKCVTSHNGCLVEQWNSFQLLALKELQFLRCFLPVCLQCRICRFNPWIRQIPWKRKWQSTPVFLPGKFHGQRSLVGYSPQSLKDLAQGWPQDIKGIFKSLQVTRLPHKSRDSGGLGMPPSETTWRIGLRKNWLKSIWQNSTTVPNLKRKSYWTRNKRISFTCWILSKTNNKHLT